MSHTQQGLSEDFPEEDRFRNGWKSETSISDRGKSFYYESSGLIAFYIHRYGGPNYAAFDVLNCVEISS